MEIRLAEIMLDKEFYDYVMKKYMDEGNVVVVDKLFLKNCLWRNNELKRLREFYDKHKAIIEGQKIKEEMGL